MDFDPKSTLDNDKAQHEPLVQEVDEPNYKISTFSLIRKPAILILIPLAPTLVSIYLGFSWTECFRQYLHTYVWLYTGKYYRKYLIPTSWDCLPNGNAIPIGRSFDHTVWDTSQFLDITLGFGSFEFSVAKGIDVGWDLIVGRGGQIILALLSYRVLSRVLLHSMETRATSFYTYTALGFDRGPLFSSWASLRDLWSGRSQGRRILPMVIYASLYLLAFPTFVSTMTGYKPNYSAWVYLSKDEAMYPAEAILPVSALIKDGSRVGLTDDFPVVYAAIGTGRSSLAFAAELAVASKTYMAQYTPGSNDTPSSFVFNGNNISLPPPRLTFEEVTDDLWLHNNKTYTTDDIHATCQPGKTYQWGFSFFTLLAFCITTTMYAIIMYSLWLRTYLHSRSHRAGQELGLFRAAMDFADALKARTGEDCTDKTEKQLADLVNSYELRISCKNMDDLPPPRVRRRGKQRPSL